ncbi:conserved hypothetical protein [Culex quinquefasciatus]|uniref:Uncharacterized protein n=1 Tax=Culex quinquefasciatus TaxID=7176 RepID=B0WCU4_CULQU|nr:conserved hypothetical protein [Culex quinquefasciatus]|eukprot:XP_001846528.1 conserved hypothetical protein [Culex quinquefasciatus]
MKWILPAVALALSAISGVQCSFGLDINLPISTQSITQAIGSGITSVVKANGTLKASAEVDTSGTVQNLIYIANNVTSPMNQLLGGVLSVTTARSGDVSMLFDKVSMLFSSTSSAIDKASAVVSNLEGLTKATLIQGLGDNLTSLSKSLTNLSSGWQNLTEAAKNAASSPTPLTLVNIGTYINASILANVTTPLKAAHSSIDTIATFITTIGTERTQALNHEARVNTSINDGLRNIANAEMNFNRTIADVFQRIGVAQINTFKNINQTYAPILAKVDQYNGGNVTNMTQFLADLAAANVSLTQFIELSSNYSTEQIYTVLRDQITVLSDTLLNITANITNLGITNTSQFATQCTQRYVQQIQQLRIRNLENCISSELNSFRPTLTFVNFQLDLIKNAANAPFTQITRTCQRGNGQCASALFAAFPDHSTRIQNKISVVAGGVSNDEHIVTGRIRDCIIGATTDLIDSAQSIQDKFNGCLVTGA